MGTAVSLWWQKSQDKLFSHTSVGKRQAQMQDSATYCYFWFSALFGLLSIFLQGIFRDSRVSFLEGLWAYRGAHPWVCIEALDWGRK